MKEATGELNMTVVTLVAISAIAALFAFVVWPMIKQMLVQQTCNTYGEGWTARKAGTGTATGGSGDATVEKDQWTCCKGESTTDCIDVD